MTTIAAVQELVPHQAPSIPALRAADRGVASSLESVLSDNTRRVYGTQWRLFQGWCDEVGLSALPAEPHTVARYLAARANSGASIATMCLAASAITKAHEWAKRESPCRDPGVRASLKGWGRPPCQATAPVRRPHRRRSRRDPPHRRAAPQARPRLRNG